MKKDKKRHSIYATVTAEEGVNYREIADMMSEIGFKMNHSSARNYVLRVMRKFAYAIVDSWQIELSDQRIEKAVKSSQFQQVICSILQSLEAENQKL